MVKNESQNGHDQLAVWKIGTFLTFDNQNSRMRSLIPFIMNINVSNLLICNFEKWRILNGFCEELWIFDKCIFYLARNFKWHLTFHPDLIANLRGTLNSCLFLLAFRPACHSVKWLPSSMSECFVNLAEEWCLEQSLSRTIALQFAFDCKKCFKPLLF